MLEWWLPGISRVRDGDYIPMGSEMLPKNGVVRLADLPALEVEVGYCLQQPEANRQRSQ